MKKNNILLATIFVIIAIIYNFIVFTTINTKEASFWIAYVFTTISFLTMIISFVSIQKQKTDKDNAFFKMPIITVSVIYSIIQLLTSFIFMIWLNINITISSIVQTIFLAVALIIIFTTQIGTNNQLSIEHKINSEISYLRNLEIDINKAIKLSDEECIKKSLKNLAEIVRYSDPVSNETLTGIETDIANSMNNLLRIIKEDNTKSVEKLIKQIETKLISRNDSCKLLK